MDTCSGKFVLRLSPGLHDSLRLEAKRRGVSLNGLCENFLQGGLRQRADTDSGGECGFLLVPLQKRFGRNLLGIFIFGSQVTGEATASSDIDLLVVLDRKVPLDRSLYRWWDQSLMAKPRGYVINPQFVRLPQVPEGVGGLWLEVALAHERVWEKGRQVSAFLGKLRQRIAQDKVRRHLYQGQPYWVWREEAAA